MLTMLGPTIETLAPEGSQGNLIIGISVVAVLFIYATLRRIHLYKEYGDQICKQEAIICGAYVALCLCILLFVLLRMWWTLCAAIIIAMPCLYFTFFGNCKDQIDRIKE